jgi:hypothetical protein
MSGHNIVEDAAFKAAVIKVGGYEKVDLALSTIMDGLTRNPFGYREVRNQVMSFRYAVTKRIGAVPPLVVMFAIDAKGAVHLADIEEYENPY